MQKHKKCKGGVFVNLKKFFLTVVSICVFITGCSLNGNSEKTYDNAFLRDFTKGLTERWDMNDDYAGEVSENEHRKQLIQIELDRVLPYANRKFEDTNLQEMAISYINLLNKQKESLSYYSVDFEKYAEMWAEAYDNRTQLIKEFIEKYNLEFSERHSEIVNDILTNAKLVANNEKLEEAVRQMTGAIVFEKVKTSYGWADYEAIIENTTEKTFDSFSVDINLLDEDGVIIDTSYASVQNFAPGKKAKLEFSTDTKFASYEITSDYYINE